jgi:hypothetical protein
LVERLNGIERRTNYLNSCLPNSQPLTYADGWQIRQSKAISCEPTPRGLVDKKVDNARRVDRHSCWTLSRSFA